MVSFTLTLQVLLASFTRHVASTQLPAHGSTSPPGVADRGTFPDPSVHVRPKFRYWIPDASVDPRVVANDVKAAKDAGMGGLQLLGYYLYGGPPSNGAGRGLAAPVDWAKYGFGTQAWYETFRSFSHAIADNKMVMDLAMGPNQGAGVPAPEDSTGLAWDIAAYNISLPLGSSFDAQLPGWGTGALQAAITGLTVSQTTVTRPDKLAHDPGSLAGDLSLNRTQRILAASSLTDVTDQVTADGHLRIDFSSHNATGLDHTIFVVYLIQSHYRAQDGPLDLGGPQTAPTSYLQNGSWAVDHFSALGAQTITSFWERHILQNGTRELVRDVGKYLWEDSIEIEANVYWTKGFEDYFFNDHGYYITKWLPTLFHRNGHYKNSNPSVWWVTDEQDHGNSHIADYRASLARRYQSYLTGLTQWSEKYLNLDFSAQISYNLPMDMLENIPYVDVPECESLDFSDLIDGYRQYAGPAHLAERPIVSSECGAVRGEGFVQTLPELLWHVKRSYAGGINQFVFHGMPYGGEYGKTTWPVFTTFNYQYSDMHGPHRPDWEFYPDQMDFVARNNWIMQAGKPKIDVAFWQKVTTYPGHVQLRTYEPTDLEFAGYTYEYLSPNNFDLPSARVVNSVLAPDAQSFKALVLRANDSLTIEGVSKLVQFARDGLPIVCAGDLPQEYVGTYNPIDLRKSRNSLREIATLPNVHVTDELMVASTLSSIGIVPRTKIRKIQPGSATWFTQWREADESVYVYVYNDAMYSPQGSGSSTASIEFQHTGVPMEYNVWTGEQKPLMAYTQTENSIIVPLQLAGNQSTVIAFPNDRSKDGHFEHISALREDVLGHRLADNGSLVLQVAKAASILTDWTLVAEHWDPPADLFDMKSGASKHNTTHHLANLVSWQKIAGLQQVSGRGYYSTTFSWDGNQIGADGAFLDFGWVYDTLQVTLNGHRLPPLDVTAPKADVKEYLVKGTNHLQAVVGTPLGNVLIPIWYKLQTSGEGPGSPDATTVPPPVGDYGLQADVKLIPYIERSANQQS